MLNHYRPASSVSHGPAEVSLRRRAGARLSTSLRLRCWQTYGGCGTATDLPTTLPTLLCKPRTHDRPIALHSLLDYHAVRRCSPVIGCRISHAPTSLLHAVWKLLGAFPVCFRTVFITSCLLEWLNLWCTGFRPSHPKSLRDWGRGVGEALTAI